MKENTKSTIAMTNETKDNFLNLDFIAVSSILLLLIIMCDFFNQLIIFLINGILFNIRVITSKIFKYLKYLFIFIFLTR